MATEDLDLVRRGYEALARGDFQTLLAMCEPAVQETFAGLLGPRMAEWRLEAVAAAGADEVRATLSTPDGRMAHVLTVRDGRVAAFRDAGPA